MADVVLGIDIGTTGVKALAAGWDGAVHALCRRGVTHRFPEPGYAEQDPFELAEAVAHVVRAAAAQARADGHRLRALSFSSVMHGIFAVDEANRPLTAMMTWADTRAAQQADALRAAFPDLYERTGVPMHPMLPAAKLRWLRDAWPGFQQAARFVSFKQWLLAEWCGRHVEDRATAGATGLLNLRTLRWDAELLAAAGVREPQLGQLVPCTTQMTVSSGQWLQHLGLPEPLPVVVGATDGLLATVGSGVFGPRMYSVTAGTSGAVRKMTPGVALDPQARTFSYILDADHWVAGGATNNAGLALSWLAAQIGVPAGGGGGDGVMGVFSVAQSVPAGADGLLFLPYLAGERAPHWNERARGVLFGLDVRHSRAHMLRAGIEGVAFALRSIHDLLSVPPDMGSVPSRDAGQWDAGQLSSSGAGAVVRASGGLFYSPLWCQLVADVLATPVEVTEQEEVSGAGAAHWGFFALGEHRRLEDVQSCVRVRTRFEPQEERVRIYAEQFGRFQEVYRRLEPCFGGRDG